MKKTLSLKLFLVLILVNTSYLYGQVIWEVNFSADVNKGFWGSNSDMLGVTEWELDVSNCDLADDGDYVKVVGTNSGRLEAVDCDGQAIWKSKSINVSDYTNLSISLLVAETGSSTSVEKYVKVYYQLDGGVEIPFQENGENIGNWGSLEAKQSGISGNQLVVVVRLNNPNSGDKVYFDNVVVNGEAIIPESDKYGKIIMLDSLQEPNMVDSKINQPNLAVNCFHFRIDETNQAKDGLPTQVSRITFFNAHPENEMSWKDSFGGFLIFSQDIRIETQRVSIAEDSITIDFIEGQLNIPEGDRRDFDLRCYFNSEKPLEEGKEFQFEIKNSAMGFSTFPSGSGFDSGNNGFLSSKNIVAVEASQLTFSEIPERLVRSKYFSVSVVAQDEFGNMDNDAGTLIELALKLGEGVLESNKAMKANLQNGSVIFDSLQYSRPDTIQLSATGEGVTQIVSNEIIVENTQNTRVVVDSWNSEDSVVSSLSISKEMAIEGFRFTVTDSGNDDMPTILKQIKIQASNKNQVNWEESLAGFFLRVGNEDLDANFSWDKNSLIIQFSESEVRREIAIEDSVKYSVWYYLKKGKIIDGEIFQMEIDPLHEDWIVDIEGSGLLPEFYEELSGPEFNMEVIGTQMEFATIPKTIEYQSEFTVEIVVKDSLGNIDSNSFRTITLLPASGSGEISSASLIRSVENGIFSWNDLVYSKAENFTLQAESKGIPTILSGNISGVDRTSIILKDDFSLNKALDPLAIDKNLAQPILNFRISDQATHDLLPTNLSTMKFFKVQTEGSFNWKKHIAGAVLLSNGKIIAATTDVNDECIRFYSSKGLIEIPNGSEINCQLAVYFKKGQLPDNKNLQVFIPNGNHEWKTLGSGSEIDEQLPEDILSDVHFIDVKASHLSFLNYPFLVKEIDDNFSLKIGACDVHQNIDQDVSCLVSIHFLNDSGAVFDIGNQVSLENGIVKIDSIQFNEKGEFRSYLNSDLPSDSITFSIGKDELGIRENFETQNLTNWLNVSDWMISSYQPIKGDYSLKHNLSNQTGTSCIAIPLNNLCPGEGSFSWSFILRNGDWDPTSGNSFVFHLLMDNENPKIAKMKYSVGINLSGSEDLLSLWKIDENEGSSLLVESEFNWNEDESVAIWVTLDATGLWELKYNRLGEMENWIFAGNIASEMNLGDQKWFSGLTYNFETPSRAGDLWFDGLEIKSINTAPFLKHYEILSQDTIQLNYSESLDSSFSTKPENFKLLRSNTGFSEIKEVINQNNNALILVLANSLITGDYRLEIENISDRKGAVRKFEDFEFVYSEPIKPFDVVINEIMAEEMPSKGLPEYEYLELYNTKDYPISVENWQLMVGDKTTKLGRDSIEANGYLILCSNSAAEQFSDYGDALGVSSFPSLNNSGAKLQILSSDGTLLDQVSYSNSWYKSENKDDGGWSLERIDPKNTFWQENNWTMSVDTIGGTPGKRNSVDAKNPDNVPPNMETVRVISANTLKIRFSEPIDPFVVQNANNYEIVPELSYPIQIFQIDQEGMNFELVFQDNFVVNQRYKLLLNSKIVDLAGNSLVEKEQEFWIPAIASKGDLVINEILFNPYPGGSDYVEVLNVSENIIDLSQLRLGKKNEEYQIEDTIRISEIENLIHPNEYALITADTTNVLLNYPFSDLGAFHQVKQMPSYNDENGRVILLSNDELIDDFAYDENMHFELLSSVEGVALERINPIQPTNDEYNWQSAAQSVGFGTPGRKNSVYNDSVIEETEISLSSKTFSPDNDGVEDRLYINFNLREEGYLANVRIYDSVGNEVRKLATNLTLAVQDKLYWDGLTSLKDRAPVGIYLVYIELYSPQGKSKAYKKTFVLGGKFN